MTIFGWGIMDSRQTDNGRTRRARALQYMDMTEGTSYAITPV
jgi:hypothetical protein